VPSRICNPAIHLDISANFDKLVERHIGAPLRRDIKNTVRSVEGVQFSDLTKLQGQFQTLVSARFQTPAF
jgi:hypothetical protein